MVQAEPAVEVVVKPQVEAPKKKPLPEVVILVSEAIPPYQEVADELKRLFPRRSTVAYLSGAAEARKQLISLLKKPDYQQYVAIGLAAAQEVQYLVGSEDELVFCQVFNYQDHSLISPKAKGVSALPGSKEMFSTWAQLSPALKQVAVITGPGLEAEVREARQIASGQGITLLHRVVHSDKEMLFEYKQMAAEIQGLWMLPDNRVLSARTIKELMSFSLLNGKQVVVFNDSLLRLGGLMSVTSRSSEIAAKVARRLNAAYKEEGVPGDDLLLLEQGELQINAVVAKRYNLNYRGE